MSSEEKFKGLIGHIHLSLLKPLGFKKSGQTFRKIAESDGITYGYLINFQRSAYNDSSELKFTVNLARKKSETGIDPKFKGYDCGIDGQERLAFLTDKYGFDKWWSITSETDMISLEEELLFLLRVAAFPWFGIQ